LVYIDDEGNNLFEKGMIKGLKLAFYHNLAAVYLHVKDHENALFACD